MRHERALQARLECRVTASPGLHPGLSERRRWGRQGNEKTDQGDGQTGQARLWWLPSEEEPLPDGRGSACCRRWEPDRFVCEMRHERALQARLECKVTASPGLHPGLSERPRWGQRDNGKTGWGDGQTDQARLWWLPSKEEPLPDGRGSACCRRWEPDRFVCEMRHR